MSQHLCRLLPCAQPAAPRAQRRRQHRCSAEGGSGDLITSWVEKLFGKAAVDDPRPAGLARMTKEEWPDQWPAVTDEFASPLAADEGEVLRLRPLLKQTQLEFLPLALAYDADVHGWSEDAFHARMDGQGAALLVLETRDGLVAGAYNPKGWLGYGDWRDAISAFLFLLPGGKDPVKLAKTGGSGMAIIDEQGGGPQWGPDGLKVNLSGRSARSRLGSYYERMPGGGKSLFGADAGAAAPLLSCRVYVGLGESAKAKDYAPGILQWQPGELEKLRKEDGKQ